jgi:hypothetical protein
MVYHIAISLVTHHNARLVYHIAISLVNHHSARLVYHIAISLVTHHSARLVNTSYYASQANGGNQWINRVVLMCRFHYMFITVPA